MKAISLCFLLVSILSCTGAAPEPVEPAEPPVESTPPAAIIPALPLSMEDLETMTAELPRTIRENILARPEFFLELVRKAAQEPEALTVLVDKNNALAPDYKPEDLVSLNDYPLAISRNDLSLSRSIMPHLLALDEAAKADGITLVFSSSFRSWEYQKGLYERYVQRHGREEADRFSARPGHSQHQLGTVVDFGSITEAFADTDAGGWMAQNAGNYGFSLSYPKGGEELTGYMWEPWHFRFTGTRVIDLQEEFFEGSQQRTLQFLHDNRDSLLSRD
jgi:D-alanyl-D-alanine carboxypeptidase